jgi:sugar O-acyltransferase (sialic acid O-acetyltransferase NeuD family)
MTKKIVIIGAGGSAREVLDIFDACNDAGQHYDVVGFLVESGYGTPGTNINDKPILGDLDWLIKNAADVQVICGVGDPLLRKRLVEKAQSYGSNFDNAIHPSAILTKRITLGHGIVIGAGCILTNQISIGNHVHINVGCTISHDAAIGAFTTLSPGIHVAGYVSLGVGCFVGTAATIIDRKNIGAWSVVGAGSVIISDVPELTTVAGVPAKLLKSHIINKAKKTIVF